MTKANICELLGGEYDEKFRDRFWSKVNKTESCWEWQGFIQKTGYGQVGYYDGLLRTNRAAWMLTHGKIPEDMVVCHTCDNRKCVNPNHLFLGTQKENLRDMRQKKRHMDGDKIKAAKLDKEQIAEIKQLHKTGMVQREIAEQFNICQQQVSNIINDKQWRNLL